MIIRDVSIVSIADGRISPHCDVLTGGERILDVRPSAVRRTGQHYMIPGLWDMHVHLRTADAPKYVANGVTGVRDMGSDLAGIRLLQARIERGEIIGPRIYASGPAIVASAAEQGSTNPVNVVSTPDDARRVFDRYYDQRVNFIHIIDLDARSFAALAERSRHDGIPFAGCLPDSVPAATAALDRMVTMEHLKGIGLACSSKQDELRAKLLRTESQHDETAMRAINEEISSTYNPEAASSLFDLFRRYGTWQTPSLTWWSRTAGEDSPEYEFARKLTLEMARAHVPLLAGADAGENGTVPGTDLHRELALMVVAGLSPAEALRTATLEPARMMRRADSGEVKTGFLADLLVLSANPLEDIRNTRAIEQVIVRGKPAGAGAR